MDYTIEVIIVVSVYLAEQQLYSFVQVFPSVGTMVNDVHLGHKSVRISFMHKFPFFFFATFLSIEHTLGIVFSIL